MVWWEGGSHIFLIPPSIYLLFIYFCLFRATTAVYGGSQARGPIGAAAASLCHSHSTAGSPTHRAGPGIEPTTSRFLVGFVSTEPQREILPPFIFCPWETCQKTHAKTFLCCRWCTDVLAVWLLVYRIESTEGHEIQKVWTHCMKPREDAHPGCGMNFLARNGSVVLKGGSQQRNCLRISVTAFLAQFLLNNILTFRRKFTPLCFSCFCFTCVIA